MRPDMVVLAQPLIDDGLSLPGGSEPFGIQDLPAQGAIEPFVVAVLPWRARIDLNGFDADPEKPVLEWSRAELRAVVGTQVFRFVATEQQRIKGLQDFCRAHPCRNLHAQRFAGVLVQHGQHLVASPVAQPVVDEVDRPDMVRVLRPQADNRCIVVIKPLAAFVPMRQLQAFLAPDSLDLLVIDGPAFGSQELADLAVAVAAILFGKTDQGQPQVILALRDCLIAQGVAGDSEDLAGPPLGCPELLAPLDNSSS